MVGHISPEAELGGPIALIEDGDEITIDANKDILELNISDNEIREKMKELNEKATAEFK